VFKLRLCEEPELRLKVREGEYVVEQFVLVSEHLPETQPWAWHVLLLDVLAGGEPGYPEGIKDGRRKRLKKDLSGDCLLSDERQGHSRISRQRVSPSGEREDSRDNEEPCCERTRWTINSPVENVNSYRFEKISGGDPAYQ
jgi:hypothetical protein